MAWLSSCGNVAIDFEDYCWYMAQRQRLIHITSPEGVIGLCTFFIVNSLAEAEQCYARSVQEMPADDPSGSVVYIDKLLAKEFNRALWRALEDRLAYRVPHWTVAVWYRPGQTLDRRYTYYRKGKPHASCLSS